MGYGGVSASAQPGNPEASAVAGYLNSGRADRALMTMTSTAEQLLQRKDGRSDRGDHRWLCASEAARAGPQARTIGRTTSPTGSRVLPDGAVIAGAVAARRGDDEVEGNWFKKAVNDGSAEFRSSRGLSLLAAETSALMHTTDASDIADAARRRRLRRWPTSPRSARRCTCMTG